MLKDDAFRTGHCRQNSKVYQKEYKDKEYQDISKFYHMYQLKYSRQLSSLQNFLANIFHRKVECMVQLFETCV